ncbi:MAG: hypothetical protein MRY63_10620 [Neomegalonema sp.]|nr:hypothetical protein [Neomegalonema sp.]
MSPEDLTTALARMPQKGAMLLIERIEAMDAQSILCTARDHGAADYPLRVDGDLEPVSLVEIGAQAAAAHASIHGVGDNHAGLLLSVQRVVVLGQIPPDTRLQARATQLHFGEGGAKYRFVILAGTTEILHGEALMRMQRAPL